MIHHPVRHLNYSIAGVSALVGRTISVDEWAQEFRIPNRKVPGAFLTGEDVHRITGIEAKSWDPELFRDFSKIVDVGREALRAAQASAEQIDAVIVASATPYEVQLDSDGFRLLRSLGIPDHVAPFQLAAGCARHGPRDDPRVSARRPAHLDRHLRDLQPLRDVTGVPIQHQSSIARGPLDVTCHLLRRRRRSGAVSR